LGYKAKNTVI